MYANERLLYRIYRSGHAGAFVLKGAMLFHVGNTRLPYRPTRDIDLRGEGRPNMAGLQALFHEFCNLKVVDDGLFFNGQSVKIERIRQEEEYHGVRARLEARMGSVRIPVQVDIGFGDAITIRPKQGKITTLLDFPPPHIRIYPWETVIAEKFQVIVQLGMANSRMKDYFDLHHLAKSIRVDGRVLARAIKATFDCRKTPLPAEVPIGLSGIFSQEEAKQAQWKAFISRSRIDTGSASFASVISILRSFLIPPVTALVEKRIFKEKWRPGGPWL